MVVYDITQERTFDNILNWLRGIEEVLQLRLSLQDCTFSVMLKLLVLK